MTLLSIYNGIPEGYTSDYDIFALLIIIIPIIVALIVIVGIWEIHKSINRQTAVQLRQAEALEQLVYEIRNQNIAHTHNNPIYNSNTNS